MADIGKKLFLCIVLIPLTKAHFIQTAAIASNVCAYIGPCQQR